MERLSITNFKGIYGPLEIHFRNDAGKILNCLMYSENGGGKTSIAEAIRICVCYSGWEKKKIPVHVAGQNRTQHIQSQLAGYLRNPAQASFNIEIDGNLTFTNLTQRNGIPASDFFIFGRQELEPSSRINLESLLNDYCICLSEDISNYLTDDNITLIIDEVNGILKDTFKEDISCIRLQEAGIFVGIKGIIGDNHIGEGIHLIVNEARQNLVKILLFLSFLKCLPPSRKKDDKCIVLDDIMSSLDLENRILLARYLIDYGREYQLIVLTHNVGFYNLMRHTAAIEDVSEDWMCVSLYRIDDKEELYSPLTNESVKNLIDRFGGQIRPTQTEAINTMRKKLEFLLHEFGKILTLGIQEETKDLIGHLVSSHDKGYYCCIHGDNILTATDLLKRISNIVNNDAVEDIRAAIQNQFDKFDSTNDMKDIAETIRHVHTYQKVVLHPGSHDQGTSLSFSSEKEIRLTLDLMRKLEAIVSKSSASYPYFI